MLKQIEYEGKTYILDGVNMWVYENGKMIQDKFIPCLEKPPVGLIPEWLRLEERIQEIEEAIKRYEVSGYEIPFKWRVELGCKRERLNKITK